MNKEYLTDSISDEVLVTAIDKMLRYEKNRKTQKPMWVNILKIAPAVAVIALVIGLVNILPVFNGGGFTAGSEGVEMGEPDIEINLPAVYATEEEATEADEEVTEEVPEVDPYAHVRFGETRDILLLEIEWFESGDEYWEYITNVYYASFDEAPSEQTLEYEKNRAMEIDNKTIFVSKTVNGKPYTYLNTGGDGNEPIGHNSDGYLVYNVYPYYCVIYYSADEIEFQFKDFGIANSKSEYERIFNDEIKPFCDELLEKGLLPQTAYDYYLSTENLLAYYVDLYF